MLDKAGEQATMAFQMQQWNPNVQRDIKSAVVQKYLKSLLTMAPATLRTYRARLYPLIDYSGQVLKSSPDGIISDIRAEKLDPYDFLSSYASYLKGEKKVSDNFLRDLVITTRSFMEFNKIFFNDRQLRATVRLPRPARRYKEPIDKNDVVTILQNIHNSTLHLYVLMLAATGMRAKEALSLRLRNLELESEPGKIFVEAEFTKTKTDRYVFMTRELKKTIKSYLKQKYSPKIMRIVDEKSGRRTRRSIQLKQDQDDLLFAPYNTAKKREPNINTLYIATVKKLNKVIDSIGNWKRERHSGFREITRHTFRRFVKSVISDLGHADFSEWYIGHIGSTYYRKKESERVQIFQKIEPYLTFLDVVSLEAKGADIQSQIEQKDLQIRAMQEQMGLMMAYMTESDPKMKAEISRKLIEKGYMPKAG